MRIDDVFAPLPAIEEGGHHVRFHGTGPKERDVDDEVLPLVWLELLEELPTCTVGERLHTDRREQVVGDVELSARVDATVLAPEPFAVEQMGAREVGTPLRAAEPLDRFLIQAIGGLPLADERLRACHDAEPDVRARGPR